MLFRDGPLVARNQNPAAIELMARQLGCTPAETGLHHPRPPLRPLPFGDLVDPTLA